MTAETAGLEDLSAWDDDLPEAARAALAAAAASWDDTAVAAAHIEAALAAAPDHLATRLGAYKFHFYKKRLAEAAPLALWCVGWSLGRLGLDTDWRRIRPGDAAFGDLERLPRLFLFALKAYGYVLVRSGALAEGRAAVAKVAELDPADRVGAVRLLAVIDRGGAETE